MTAHNPHQQQQQHWHTEAQNHSYCVAERKLRDRHPAPPTGTSWSNDCCGLCRGLTVNLWGRSWFIPVRRNLTIRVQSSAFHSLDSSTFFFSPPVKALHYSILHIYISNIRTLLSSLIFLFLPSCPRGPGFRIIPQDPTQTTVSWLISSVSQNMETWGHTEFALHYYYTWISHTDWFRSFEMFQKMFQTWNIKQKL